MKKILNFENSKKFFSKKRIIVLSVILAILIIIISLSIIYCANTDFRNFLDKYLFRKNVSEEKLVSIQLDYDSNVNVIGYNKYICVLAENKLMQYNSSGNLVNEIKLEINNPIYHVNNKYLVISEKNSSKFYLISDSKILWEKDVDGMINKIDVNKNGYVSVILVGTTYKSVIVTYDSKGNELFKTYRSSTTALDATISPDNQYLSFAEINTTGTIIQSNIKNISIEKAKETPSESIIFEYEAPSGSLVTNIEYQDKDKLVCIYDDAIHVISNNKDEMIMNLQEEGKKINSADIKLGNHIYRAIEKQTGLFKADTSIEIMNTNNKKETVYTVDGVTKNIYCYSNILAINLGQEVEFINTSGWLIKKYTSSKDIQSITIGNGLAGIIYKDKVEIINL